MITASEVAKKVGVSVSTIGRAIADDPRISAETKARVRLAAEQLGYVGNNPARIMRGGSSNLIGLMIPDVANDFYAAIAQTMSACFDREGYRLVLSLTHDDRDVEARQIREILGARSAGLILVPTANPRRESRAMLSSVPHVQFLRHIASLGGSSFLIDDEAAIRGATLRLIRQGHRRIAYIGGQMGLSTGAARAAGFRAAMAEAGYPADAAFERLGPPTSAFGASEAATLLSSAKPPTALLTGSVHITEGVVETMERLKVNIPRDLSLLGFGGAPWFKWWRGGLSAVCPPVEDLATGCALWFLNNLRKKQENTAADHESIVNCSLVERATTAHLQERRPLDRK